MSAPNQKISPSQSLSENALLLPLQNAKNNLVSTFKILRSIPLENDKYLTTFHEGQKLENGETTEASASSAAHDVFVDFCFVFQTKALKNKTLMKSLILVPKQLNLTGFTPKERAGIRCVVNCFIDWKMYRLSKLEQTVRRPKRLPLHPAKSAQKNCRHLCPHGDRSPLKVTTDNCLEIDSRVHTHIYRGPLLDSCALSTYLCEAVGNGINIYWFSPSMVHVLIRSWYFPHLAQIIKNCYTKLTVSFYWEENQVLPLNVSFFSATLPWLWRFHHPLQARLNSNFLHIAQKLIKSISTFLLSPPPRLQTFGLLKHEND